MPLEKEYPRSFDPYLRYALDTTAAFRSFMNMGPEELPLSLLVTLVDMDAAQFREAISRMTGRDEVQVGPAEDPAPYVTVRIPATLAMSPDWFPFWDRTTSSVTLSIPVDMPRKAASRTIAYDPDRPRSKARTIVGIMDDGCAFAHARLRGTGLGTRVLAVWDQERGRQPVEVSTAPLQLFGRRPLDFDYGLEFWRGGGSSAIQPGAQEVGIDAWIATHVTPTGTVDEDRCYAHGGFVSLRRRATHGAHVADVLAGWVPTSARLSMDRKTAPTFARDAQATWADTDIVFVQIPQDGVNDASGQWLRTQVIDGLRYILSCAGPATERVVFNLSYGRTTGPHDGTGPIEDFLSHMAAVYDGKKRKPALEVVLPAGNSRASASHVAFRSSQALSTQWTWRIPPDNTVPVMAEVRVRNNQAAHVIDCKLDPPAPYPGQPAETLVFQGAHDKRWVLVVPPTRPDGPNPPSSGPALHGDWTITVTCSHPGVGIHAYVARTDPNMGARPGAKQSRFIDPIWELTQGAAASQGPWSVPEATGSLVRASGTLNGIATASAARVYVAAGYCIANQRPSPYSSAGPSRGARGGPDYAVPTDESIALTGIPGAGTRSGGVFRLVGTSAAAPQLARLLIGPARPNPCPAGGAPADPDAGCGMLAPP